MSVLVFDTHVCVKSLWAVGFSEEQAEMLSALIEGQLATKGNLGELEKRLTCRPTFRLGSMMVAAAGIVAALVKLLYRLAPGFVTAAGPWGAARR